MIGLSKNVLPIMRLMRIRWRIEMDKKIVEDFVKERNEALLSLDKEKIIAFMGNWAVDVPQNDLVFWAMVHKAIVNLREATKEQKDKSFAWLLEIGFNPMIKH